MDSTISVGGFWGDQRLLGKYGANAECSLPHACAHLRVGGMHQPAQGCPVRFRDAPVWLAGVSVGTVEVRGEDLGPQSFRNRPMRWVVNSIAYYICNSNS